MPSTTIKYFAFAHLPPHLQAVSKPIGELAAQLEQLLPDGPEKSGGMRKLLEAKDCFVRSALDAPKDAGPASTLPPHQQRVIDERTELDDKLGKLVGFTNTVQFSTLPGAEQARMRTQAVAMRTYSEILAERIAAF
jgi:hypothetical protein